MSPPQVASSSPKRLQFAPLGVVLFQPPVAAEGGRLAALLWLAGLYGAGVLHWLVFFLSAPKTLAFSVMHFSDYQWPREFAFLSTLQEAVQARVIPYHSSVPLKETTRFLGIPDYVLSPQILLLDRVDLATFVLLNTVLLYSISFLGCLLLRHRYGLSLYAFTVLVLLFNFNGNVTAQIGAGHYVWAGFFLLPFVCAAILRLVEGERSARWAVGMALLLFALILQGTYHFYTWSVGFLLLLAAFHAPARRSVALTVALSLPLVSVRVLPAALTFWGAERSFISGYPTLEHLLAGLVWIRPHSTLPVGVLGNLAWWEYDVYIGLLGLALVGVFGLYLAWRTPPDMLALRYRPLDAPMAVMALFSMSLLYAPITSLPLPLLGGERVSSRFLILPLLLLILLATLRLNRWLPRHIVRPGGRPVALAALALLALSLVQHSNTWRVSVLEAEAAQPFDLARVDALLEPTMLADPLYLALVNGSLLLSATSFVLLFVLWGVLTWREWVHG